LFHWAHTPASHYVLKGGADSQLCFVWQLISDAGYQGEITSVSTACQQLEVFSRVLRTSLATILDGGEENLEKNLPEFAVSSLLCES
jgi:hypothetical protein